MIPLKMKIKEHICFENCSLGVTYCDEQYTVSVSSKLLILPHLVTNDSYDIQFVSLVLTIGH